MSEFFGNSRRSSDGDLSATKCSVCYGKGWRCTKDRFPYETEKCKYCEGAGQKYNSPIRAVIPQSQASKPSVIRSK